MNERKYTIGIHLATKTKTKKGETNSDSNSETSIKEMIKENITCDWDSKSSSIK